MTVMVSFITQSIQSIWNDNERASREYCKERAYLPYRIPKDSIELAAKVKNPIESSDEVLKEAKVLYERYCIHCHGEKGMGDGLVGQVYKGVTAYNSRAVKDRSEGHIFHVITHGKGECGAWITDFY